VSGHQGGEGVLIPEANIAVQQRRIGGGIRGRPGRESAEVVQKTLGVYGHDGAARGARVADLPHDSFRRPIEPHTFSATDLFVMA
jgi:hypothetical protein